MEQAKSLCGQANLTIQPLENGSGCVAVQEGAGVDLGSMAKGKAAELLKAYLQDQGVQDALKMCIRDRGGIMQTIKRRPRPRFVRRSREPVLRL